MPDGQMIQLIAQGGSTAVLLVVLYFLWQEYKTQSAFIRDRLDKADAERIVLAEKLGMSSSELSMKAQARIVSK